MANASLRTALLWAIPLAFIAGASISRGPTPSAPALAAVPDAPNAMMQIPTQRRLPDDTILERICKRYGAVNEAACKALIVSQVDAIEAYYQVRTSTIIQIPPYCVERDMLTADELFTHFRNHVHGHAPRSSATDLHRVTLEMLTEAYPCPRGPKGFEEVTMSSKRG